MAEPQNIANLSMGMSGAGGLLGATGNIFGGVSQSNMYQYQAGIAQLNAKIAKENESYALVAGEREAGRSGMATRFKVGETRARFGAGNLAVSSGSPKDVTDSIGSIGGMDAATIRNNAARVAYGYATEAVSEESKASAYGRASTDALVSGFLKGTGSLISGSTSVSSKWLQGNQAGIWSNSDAGNYSGSPENNPVLRPFGNAPGT